MKKAVLVAVVALLVSSVVYADISVTDRSSTLRFLSDPSVLRPGTKVLSPADRAARHAANQAKRDAERATHAHGKGRASALALHPRTLATGSVQLIDSAGLHYFINTDITFSTQTNSASGAASEAQYSSAVAATTLNGGTTMSTLDDNFDGYGAICVSLTNATGPCAFGDPAYTMFNNNGLTPFDATVPPGPTCTNRQLVYGPQTIGGLSVTRKVFVPTNDTFIRWMDFFTNTTGSPITFTMIAFQNLGSDQNTVIVNSSNGDAVAQTSDTWITSFQNYSGTTSSDVRNGAVIQGAGAPTPVSSIHFVAPDGDHVYWAYSITLAPGQTKAILNFATGQPSKAAANAKSAALALLPASSTQCLSATELAEVTNFATSADLSITKNTTSSTAFGSNPITYTLSVSNLGPSTASSVSVSDTLPAGASFVSATGTGWTCNNVAGAVTCTLPTLAVGAANPISLVINAPPVAAPGTLSNTATVSSAASDPVPANNSSTKTVPILPGSSIPVFSIWMLMMLAAVLGFVALSRRT